MKDMVNMQISMVAQKVRININPILSQPETP